MNQAKFDALGIEIIAVSRDLGPSQQKFKELVGAKNTFLSDVDAKVIKRFGALNEANGGTRRFYFLIGEDGTVLWRSVTGGLIPVEKLLTDVTAVVKPGN